MTEIDSIIVPIQATSQSIFSFLFNLNNHEKIMPKQVSEWWSNEEEAKMKIQGLGFLHLKRDTTNPNSYLRIVPVGKAPVDLYLEWNIMDDGIMRKVQVKIFAELNMMMRMVAEKPLKNLVDYMATKVNDEVKET